MSKLVISKPNISIESARPRDMVFDSNYNYIKIYKIFTGTISSATITLSHNLNYVPLVFGWLKSGTPSSWVMLPYSDGTTKTVYDADVTNIYIRQDPLGSGDTYVVAVAFNRGV